MENKTIIVSSIISLVICICIFIYFKNGKKNSENFFTYESDQSDPSNNFPVYSKLDLRDALLSQQTAYTDYGESVSATS